MSDDPFDPMRRLVNRLQQVAGNLNLNVINVAFHPDPDGINRVTAIFEITPDAVKTAAELEQEQTDKAFEELMGAFSVTEDDEGNPTLDGPDSETQEREKAEVDAAEAALEEKKRKAMEAFRKWSKDKD